MRFYIINLYNDRLFVWEVRQPSIQGEGGIFLIFFSKFARILFSSLLFILSFLVPKEKNLWLFGSSGGKRFADNAKWLFLFCSEHLKGTNCVWISKDEEIAKKINKSPALKAFHYRSIKGMIHCLRSYVCFFDSSIDDIDWAACNLAIKVQLWHGVPLKKILNDATPRELRQILFPKTCTVRDKPLKQRLWMYYSFWLYQGRHDLVVSTGKDVSRSLESAFKSQHHRIVETGYPRNDFLLTPSRKENKGFKNGKTIGYFPTFRDSGVRTFPDNFPVKDIRELLNKNDARLIVKLHKAEHSIANDLENNDFGSIKIEDSLADPYPLLRKLDILISDYSSIMFDFLFLDRPIILYAFDYEDYVTKSREMYWDYNEIAPGPIVRRKEDLVPNVEEYLNQIERGCDQWATKRQRILKKFFKFVDANASQRIVDAVFERFYGQKNPTQEIH